MLYAFGMERIGVVVSDLYFVDPTPAADQEGAERGVRLELRVLERGALHGSVYSAQPIAVGRPIWRVDLLESIAGPPGSLDRAHHHPRFRAWEPGARHFVQELSADPLAWLEAQLRELPRVLDAAGVAPDEIGSGDVAGLQRAVPEILAAVRRLLDEVSARDFSGLVEADPVTGARVGWL
jgi:hypothetical protein